MLFAKDALNPRWLVCHVGKYTSALLNRLTSWGQPETERMRNLNLIGKFAWNFTAGRQTLTIIQWINEGLGGLRLWRNVPNLRIIILIQIRNWKLQSQRIWYKYWNLLRPGKNLFTGRLLCNIRGYAHFMILRSQWRLNKASSFTRSKTNVHGDFCCINTKI